MTDVVVPPPPALASTRRTRTRPRQLYAIAAVLFLVSSVFSSYNALALTCIGLTLTCIGLALAVTSRVHAIVAWPTAFLTLLLVSGMLVGSLPETRTWRAFSTQILPFMTSEGRVFLTFTPLLLAAVCRPDNRSLEFLVRCFRVVAWFGVIIGTIGQLPPLRAQLYAAGTGQLFALSSTKHVAGFLFGTTALVLLTTQYGRRRTNVYLGLAMLGVVVLTGSRTTIVGLAFAGIASLFLHSSSAMSKRWMTRFRTIMVIGLVLFLPFQFALRVQIFEPEVITTGFDLFSNPDQPRTQRYDPRTANSLTRFQLWGAGTDRFLSSPFVGTGAFRFNDEVDDYWGVGGLVLMANEGTRTFNDSTAHSSYVHIAAETGLLGLFLLLGTWVSLGRHVRRQRGEKTASPQVRSDADGAMLILVFALGTGLTSSSLMTPGLCIPVLLYVGSVALRGDLPSLPRRPSTEMAHARSQHQ